MFGVVRDMVDRATQLDEDKMISDILADPEVQAYMVQLNQDQLQAGKGADNASLPRYDQDPYFKTQAAAKAYEAWKSHVSPNAEKPKGVMDFFIDGTFQSTIKVATAAKAVAMTSNSPIADDIQNKTDGEALGLNDNSMNKLIAVVLDRLLLKTKEQLQIA